MNYKLKPGDRVYIIEGPNMDYCPNPSRVGELATVERESQCPNFYLLEDFPGLWPVAFLLKTED